MCCRASEHIPDTIQTLYLEYLQSHCDQHAKPTRKGSVHPAWQIQIWDLNCKLTGPSVYALQFGLWLCPPQASNISFIDTLIFSFQVTTQFIWSYGAHKHELDSLHSIAPQKKPLVARSTGGPRAHLWDWSRQCKQCMVPDECYSLKVNSSMSWASQSLFSLIFDLAGPVCLWDCMISIC